MSNIHTPIGNPYPYEAKFDTYEYPIGGKMLTGTVTITETYDSLIINGDKMAVEEIKRDLVHQMAEYMLENKLVEFTHHSDPTRGDKTIKIRAYLAKNSDIKILRVYKKLADS
jgi:hypothetical protein